MPYLQLGMPSLFLYQLHCLFIAADEPYFNFIARPHRDFLNDSRSQRIPHPRSWRKGKLLPLSGQIASLKTNNTNHRPTNKWEAVCVRLVMALFPASLT